MCEWLNERVTVMMRLLCITTGRIIWKFCATPFYSVELTGKTCARLCAFMENPCAMCTLLCLSLSYFHYIRSSISSLERCNYDAPQWENCTIIFRKNSNRMANASDENPNETKEKQSKLWNEKLNKQPTNKRAWHLNWTNEINFFRVQNCNKLKSTCQMHYGHSLISINASELSHKIKLTNPHSDEVELYYSRSVKWTKNI